MQTLSESREMAAQIRSIYKALRQKRDEPDAILGLAALLVNECGMDKADAMEIAKAAAIDIRVNP